MSGATCQGKRTTPIRPFHDEIDPQSVRAERGGATSRRVASNLIDSCLLSHEHRPKPPPQTVGVQADKIRVSLPPNAGHTERPVQRRDRRTSTLLKGGGCNGRFMSFWRFTPRVSEHVISLSEGQAQELIHDCARDLVVAAMGATYNKAVEVPRRHVYGWSTTHAALHIAANLQSLSDARVRTAPEAWSYI